MLQIAVCEDEAEAEAYLKTRAGMYVKRGICVTESGAILPDDGQEFDILLVKHVCHGSVAEGTIRVKKELLDALKKNDREKAAPRERESVLVRAGGSYYRIDPDKILYAENVGRKVVLHFKNSQLAYYAKMRETEELLGDGFFRCHRGYLVNLKAVEGYETGTILLKNGESILMAKRKYNEFQTVYARYLDGMR